MRALLRVVLLVILAGMSAGCTRRVYVPVESVRTDIHELIRERVVRDTILSERFVEHRGDTIVDVRIKERVRLVEIRDTCYISERDSVAVPYPVEAKLSKWESLKLDVGGVAIGCLIGILALCIGRLIKRIRPQI